MAENEKLTWIKIGDKVRLPGLNQDGNEIVMVSGKVTQAGPDMVEIAYDDGGDVVQWPWQDMMGMSGSYEEDNELMGHPYYEHFAGEFELVTPWEQIVRR
jgi:hypothetical protein